MPPSLSRLGHLLLWFPDRLDGPLHLDGHQLLEALGNGTTICSSLKGDGLVLVQLALNAAWSPVFFSWHDTKTALVLIVALLIAIVATIVSASRVDRVATWLLAPYLVWVAYATTINAGVVAMN